jgi:hypothetical protein
LIKPSGKIWLFSICDPAFTAKFRLITKTFGMAELPADKQPSLRLIQMETNIMSKPTDNSASCLYEVFTIFKDDSHPVVLIGDKALR